MRQQMQSEIASAKADLNTQTQMLKAQVRTNNWLIEANKKNFRANFSGAKSYLTQPLSAETKLLVNEIIQAKDTTMQALQTATNARITSWTVDRSYYTTQATEILTTFRTNMLPYVATSKLSSFDTFIQSRVNAMLTNVNIRQTNKGIKMEIGNKNTTFKARLYQKRVENKNIIKQIREGQE